MHLKDLGIITISLLVLVLCPACTNGNNALFTRDNSEKGMATMIPSNQFNWETFENISLTFQQFTLNSSDVFFDDSETPYLTFSAGAEQTLQMSKAVPTLEYSVKGGDWVELGITRVTFGGENGDLRLRGKAVEGTNISYISFGNDTKVACGGDIRTLIDYENYNATYTGNARFRFLFNGCYQLTSAPDLPCMDLASECYFKMFANCTALTGLSELPATTLASSCYLSMFQGCTSLINAPVLPANNLANNCYEYMFSGCISLKKAPDLPATSLKSDCYDGMFKGCSKLNYIKMMATDRNASSCLSYWIAGVSPKGTFVKKSSASWIVKGDSGIPFGWAVETVE